MIYEFDYDNQKAAFLLEDLAAVTLEIAGARAYKTLLKVYLKSGISFGIQYPFGDEGEKSAVEVYDFLKEEIRKRNS